MSVFDRECTSYDHYHHTLVTSFMLFCLSHPLFVVSSTAATSSTCFDSLRSLSLGFEENDKIIWTNGDGIRATANRPVGQHWKCTIWKCNTFEVSFACQSNNRQKMPSMTICCAALRCATTVTDVHTEMEREREICQQCTPYTILMLMSNVKMR